MLLELHIAIQFHQRQIIFEVRRRIIRMHFFSFDAVFFVIEPLFLISYVIFTQAHLHICVRRGGHTMRRGDNPTIGHQRTATAELTRQKARFDQCRLPRMRCK